MSAERVLGIPKKSLTVSVNDALDKAKVDIIVKEPDKLTQERLEELWYQFIEQHNEDRLLKEAFRDKSPKLIQDNLFEVSISHTYMAHELMRYQTKLLQYIRKETGLQNLTMNIAFNQVEQHDDSDYYPEEKYKKMVEMNPTLKSLRALLPEISF